MPLIVVRNDVTRMAVDAIVNAANNTLLGGGGVDGAIHAAAGPELLAECRTLGGCATGQAKITGAYRLPCRYVIHTVGPVWQGGNRGERDALASCYRSSLSLAEEKGCATVAFPLISAGAYGYPKAEAFRVASETIEAFLAEHEMTVYLVLFTPGDLLIGRALYDEIAEYIDDRSIPRDYAVREEARRLSAANSFAAYAAAPAAAKPQKKSARRREKAVCLDAEPEVMCECADVAEASLSDLVGVLDESFSEMLLRKIDEKGMTDAECYKKANIDRKLFSKIRSDKAYRPSKPTAFAFAVALGLSLEETRELLMKAGFAISHSNKFDIILEYFIKNGNYNVFEINEALYSFDQNLLGG